MPTPICTYNGIEGPCPLSVFSRHLCQKHYNRLLRNGTTELIGKPGQLPDEQLAYAGMHARLYRMFGSARHLACFDCGGPAREWSYEGGDPNERIGDDGRGRMSAYSTDPSYYHPRCMRCHNAHDNDQRTTLRGNATLSPDQVIEIFTSTEPHADIRDRLGVSYGSVRNVRRRLSMRWLTDAIPTVVYERKK